MLNHDPVPTFMIAGAPKAGTTSLQAMLEQHPEIFFPYIKEPCYFSDGWHYSIDTWDKYVRLFSPGRGKKAIGEASTQYMADKDAPYRIAKQLGRIKVLFILRNPVDRAYSHWGHARYHAAIESLTFREALACEDSRHTEALKKERYYHPQVFKYFSLGLYSEYIRRYIDVFGSDNVKVIIFEEFVRDPVAFCRELFVFLGVARDFTPTIVRQNAAHEPYLRALNYFFVFPPKWIVNTFKNAPPFLKEGLYKLAKTIHQTNQSKSRQKPPLDPKLRTELLEKYSPSILALEDLIGRNLSIWRESKENPD